MFQTIGSFIIGLSISYIFYMSIQNRTCIVLDNKKMDSLTGKVHTYEGKCYNYVKKEKKCD